jgi:hypothetical protein
MRATTLTMKIGRGCTQLSIDRKEISYQAEAFQPRKY